MVAGVGAAGVDPKAVAAGVGAAGVDPKVVVAGVGAAGVDPKVVVAGVGAAGVDPKVVAAGAGAAGVDPKVVAAGVGAAGVDPKAVAAGAAGVDPKVVVAGAGAPGVDPKVVVAGAGAPGVDPNAGIAVAGVFPNAGAAGLAPKAAGATPEELVDAPNPPGADGAGAWVCEAPNVKVLPAGAGAVAPNWKTPVAAGSGAGAEPPKGMVVLAKGFGAFPSAAAAGPGVLPNCNVASDEGAAVDGAGAPKRVEAAAGLAADAGAGAVPACPFRSYPRDLFTFCVLLDSAGTDGAGVETPAENPELPVVSEGAGAEKEAPKLVLGSSVAGVGAPGAGAASTFFAPNTNGAGPGSVDLEDAAAVSSPVFLGEVAKENTALSLTGFG